MVVEEVLVATDEEDRVSVESDRDEEDTEDRDSPSQAPLQGEDELAGQEADVEDARDARHKWNMKKRVPNIL